MGLINNTAGLSTRPQLNKQMNISAPTPEQAAQQMEKWLPILHPNRPDLMGGLIYVKLNPLAHPMRRYSAGYIKGQDQNLVASRCDVVNGVHILKAEWL